MLLVLLVDVEVDVDGYELINNPIYSLYPYVYAGYGEKGNAVY